MIFIIFKGCLGLKVENLYLKNIKCADWEAMSIFFCIWDTGIRIQDAVFVDKVRGTKIKCLY